MTRTPEEISKIGEAVVYLEEAAENYEFKRDRASAEEIREAYRKLVEARNDLYDLIGGCETLVEWPEICIEVQNEQGKSS